MERLKARLKLVALRKESVDRNRPERVFLTFLFVALRKESVDRNLHEMASAMYEAGSLSARRAWIEIIGWLQIM